MTVDCAARGRLRKMSLNEAWTTIEELAQYEEEEWYDPISLMNKSSNYETASMGRKLEAMKYQVYSLTKGATSLVEKSKSLCEISKEKVRKLEGYMGIIESPDNSKSLGPLVETTPLSCLNSFPPKQLCVRQRVSVQGKEKAPRESPLAPKSPVFTTKFENSRWSIAIFIKGFMTLWSAFPFTQEPLLTSHSLFNMV
ncbi:hypothetical protein Tco_1252428 [Tanacetum coccineum]